MLRQLVIVYLVLLSASEGQVYPKCRSSEGSEAEPPWKCHQREHKSKPLNKDSRLHLCQKTDLSFIKSLLKPIVSTVRVAGSKEIKVVGRFIKNRLQEFGFHVENDRFTADAPSPHGTKTFNNIIATHNPLAPRRLMISCHYDSKYEKKFVFYGATDSAFPCALLLDLAGTLHKYLQSPKANPLRDEVSLQLVFFDGEEAFNRWTNTDSLYGSRNLARKWELEEYPHVFESGKVHKSRELDRMDVMVLLDLLGYPGTQLYNFDHGAQDLYDSLPDIGVSVVHLIPPSFPPVWHNEGDKEEALDDDTMVTFASILRVFTAEYLHLDIGKGEEKITKDKDDQHM